MATPEGLVRSFYSWLRKTESALKESRDSTLSRLPKTRPTLLSEVTPVSASVCAALKGTGFEEKAVYWRNLFETIRREGWSPNVGSNNIKEQG